MTTTIHIRRAALGMIICVASLKGASAQGVSGLRPNSRPATDVVANFEKMTSESRVVRPDELQHPEKYSAARVDSVLSGLERIAQNSSSSHLSTSAAAAIMDAGSAKQTPRGIFDRQARVYHSAKNDEARAVIVGLMPEQKDRIHALAFLMSVAAQGGGQRDYDNAPLAAVDALSRMGKQGRAALAELRDKGLLRDREARNFAIWFLSQRVANPAAQR